MGALMPAARRYGIAGLVLVAMFALAAPAEAKRQKPTKFVLLSGPHIGELIKTRGGPKVPKRLNRGLAHGKLVPQSNGNEFTFERKTRGKGRAGGAGGGESEEALLERSVSEPAAHDLARAIIAENWGLVDDSVQFVFRKLDNSLFYLDRWKTALDAAHAAGRIDESAYTSLVTDYEAAKSLDKDAQHLLPDLGAARNEIHEALKVKRGAMRVLLSYITPSLGVPDPGAFGDPVDLDEGSANAINDAGDVVGQDTSGQVPEGFLRKADGTLIPLRPSSPGQPTNGTAIDPLPAGTEGAPPNLSCNVYGPAAEPNIRIFFHEEDCGISAGSEFGLGGFFRGASGKERALALKPTEEDRKRAVRGRAVGGFKQIRVGHFAGGASLFTLNDRGLAFGDHFLHGESGPFRAFRADLRGKRHPTTELWRPRGGSTQPIASNDAGLAGGAALLSDGTVEATFWWGAKHYTRFGGEGGAIVRGMNEAGVAVGTIGPLGSTHAALFEGGVAYDLNDLIPDGSGWTLTRANDINNQGQIVGNGILGGTQHGFVLETSP